MTTLENIEQPVNINNNAEIEWMSDAVAETIRRLGIEYMTMNPGASYRGFHDSWVNYLGNRHPQMLLCLHEGHVVSIAHGYARVTGKPMGAVLHSNVGLMNGLMQIFNAWCNRVPMMILGATGPVDSEQRRPWVDWIHTAADQGALLRNFTKWDDKPASTGAAVDSLLRAHQIACTAPRGPVYVCLDAGLQETRVTGETALPDPARYRPGPAPHPAQETVRDLAERLVRAKRPLILAGRMSRDPADWARHVRLAEALGAMVLTDLRAGAAFPTDHPLHGPAPRPHLSKESQELLRQADVVLALDCVDLGGIFKLLGAPRGTDAYIVHASVDSYIHNGWSGDCQILPPVDLRVLAEPDALIAALLPEVEARTGGQTPSKWPERPAAKAELPELTDTRPIVQGDLAGALAKAREGRKFTIVRVGLGWAGEHYPFHDGLDLLGWDGGGGLGAGPGMAIGAGLALRGTGRIALSILGDGDFLQGATALWTAAHYRIPTLIIVANNLSNYNDEVHQQLVAVERGRPVENKWIGMRMTDPEVDIVALSRAQGVEAESVSKPTELAAAIERAVARVEAGVPFVLDVRIDPGDTKPLLSRAG